MGLYFDGRLIAFLFCIIIVSLGHSCKVHLCSRQYSRALEDEVIIEGPTYHYCSILRSYADCIRATARSCHGELAYHSMQSLVMQWNKLYNCSKIIEQGPYDNQKQLIRPHKHRPIPDCSSYKFDADFGHCGLFGDPHLRTFYNELQTCSVIGAWPLIDNPHLAVQITNEVLKESAMTATTKVTVIVREQSPCAFEKTYEARTNFLPGAFVDGSRWSGPGVRIREESPGSHVEIILRYVATRVVVRQVGNQLTFAIRMPRAIAMTSTHTNALELCVRGCPERLRMDLSSTKFAICHNVTDFYLEACLAGDTTFSIAKKLDIRWTYFLFLVLFIFL